MGCSLSRQAEDADDFFGDFPNFDEIIKRHTYKVYLMKGGDKKYRIEDFDYKIFDEKVDYQTNDPVYRALEDKRQKLQSYAKSFFNNRSPLD